jgi:hypothetical protein
VANVVVFALHVGPPARSAIHSDLKVEVAAGAVKPSAIHSLLQLLAAVAKAIRPQRPGCPSGAVRSPGRDTVLVETGDLQDGPCGVMAGGMADVMAGEGAGDMANGRRCRFAAEKDCAEQTGVARLARAGFGGDQFPLMKSRSSKMRRNPKLNPLLY